jgi:hypothetical protein
VSRDPVHAVQAPAGSRRGLSTPAPYDSCVFINCPFDASYRQLFRALVFTIQDCGFMPRCALEVQDSGEVRIAKIKRIVRECRHGIHDISRVELDPASGLPRFNMPLELGLFLGAQEYGAREQKQKRCLILDDSPYRYQVFCSDLAGQDIATHSGSPYFVVAAVRDWLASWLCDTGVLVAGESHMSERYREFSYDVRALCRDLHLDPDRLLFAELRTLVQEWAEQNA